MLFIDIYHRMEKGIDFPTAWTGLCEECSLQQLLTKLRLHLRHNQGFTLFMCFVEAARTVKLHQYRFHTITIRNIIPVSHHNAITKHRKKHRSARKHRQQTRKFILSVLRDLQSFKKEKGQSCCPALSVKALLLRISAIPFLLRSDKEKPCHILPYGMHSTTQYHSVSSDQHQVHPDRMVQM